MLPLLPLLLLLLLLLLPLTLPLPLIELPLSLPLTLPLLLLRLPALALALALLLMLVDVHRAYIVHAPTAQLHSAIMRSRIERCFARCARCRDHLLSIPHEQVGGAVGSGCTE